MKATKNKSQASKPRPRADVKVANALVRAAKGLTLPERRIIFLALSKLDRDKPYPPGAVVSGKVTALEYADECGADIKNAYQQLKDASKQLQRRQVVLFLTDELGDIERHISWTYRSDYRKGAGTIEIWWSPAILPYITDLKNNFTELMKRQACHLRSIYSWALLELLMQFKSTGVLNIAIDEFAHAMEAQPSHIANFSLMRSKVIEPAVLDLIEKDGLLVEWQAIKTGRKVTSLVFKFKDNPQQALDLAPKPLAKAAPPAHTPAEQQTINLIDQRLAEQRLAMLAELGIRIMPEDEIAAANAKEVATTKAVARAGAKSSHKRKARHARIEGDRQAAPETGEPSPTRTYDASADDGTDRIQFD